jgi:hypothetical protein
VLRFACFIFSALLVEDEFGARFCSCNGVCLFLMSSTLQWCSFIDVIVSSGKILCWTVMLHWPCTGVFWGHCCTFWFFDSLHAGGWLYICCEQGCTIPRTQRRPGRPNVVRWRLIFADLQYGTYFISPFWRLEF